MPQKIIEQELYGDPKEEEAKAQYTWEKDEIAFLAHAGEIAKVQFTGKRWLSNCGWRRGNLKKIYEFAYLASTADWQAPGEIKWEREDWFYTELSEAKERALAYWTRQVESAQRDLERHKPTIDDFLKE